MSTRPARVAAIAIAVSCLHLAAGCAPVAVVAASGAAGAAFSSLDRYGGARKNCNETYFRILSGDKREEEPYWIPTDSKPPAIFHVEYGEELRRRSESEPNAGNSLEAGLKYAQHELRQRNLCSGAVRPYGSRPIATYGRDCPSTVVLVECVRD